MASNRKGRINEELQRELSSLIRTLKDPRVQQSMVSVTKVEAIGEAEGHGTTVHFMPDEEIFETTVYSFDILKKRFEELAYLIKQHDRHRRKYP